MSPYALILILFATGYSYSEVPSHRMPNFRPPYKYRKNIASHMKSDTEWVNYNSTQPVYHHSHNFWDRKRGYRRNQRNEIEPYTSGIYRSYGRGNALVPTLGATVSVLNTHPKVHKGTITTRIINYREPNARPVSSEKRKCLSCPQNRAVVASKGNIHVVLPEPCPNLKWFPVSGPKPGSLLKEGTYSLLGRLGSRGKLCQYEYKVIIRRCGTFNLSAGHVNCTAEDVWGSKCTMTCEPGYDLEGVGNLECRHDMKWSDEPPTCIRKIGCSFPQTPDDTKIWCQVPNEKELIGEILPGGTYCRFKANGRQRTITCVDGYWVTKNLRGRRNKFAKRRKYRKEKLNKNIISKKLI